LIYILTSKNTIVNFSATNYRSIKDKVTLSFEAENSKDLEDYYITEPIPGLRLLKLGLIYGANGSGKTTLLKALGFLRTFVIKPLERKTSTLNFKPFLFDEHTQNENTTFELVFVHNGIKFLYEIAFNNIAVMHEKLYYHQPNKSLVYERNTDTSKQLSSIEFGSKIKIKKAHKATLEANTLWNTTVLSGFLKTNIDSKELRNATDWFNKVLKAMIVPGADLRRYVTDRLESEEINKQHIVQFLRKADFKIKDISIEKNQQNLNSEDTELFKFLRHDSVKIQDPTDTNTSEIYFQHSILRYDKEHSYRLPYREESQGTQRYYQFSGLLALMITSEVVFPIDELESSLHPDLLKHFLLVFLVNSKQSQLIATTHHRELLMDRDILRNDVIWFTSKNNDGSMKLYSLSDFDSSIVRDTTSIFNAYKSGKLGAVPELSDYYLDLNNGEK